MEWLGQILVLDRYYGLDYPAACGIAGLFLLGNRNRTGFLLYMLATVFGTGFAMLAKSLPVIITHLILFALNLRGYLRWARKRD